MSHTQKTIFPKRSSKDGRHARHADIVNSRKTRIGLVKTENSIEPYELRLDLKRQYMCVQLSDQWHLTSA